MSKQDVLPSIIPHVFLPPKLPQESLDEELEQQAHIYLCETLYDTAMRYRDGCPSVADKRTWDTVLKMLQTVQAAVEVPMTPEKLSATLKVMEDSGA
jgi:hypothetical protein